MLSALCPFPPAPSRLLPCGLHIIGEAPTGEEAIATLVNIGELDRPDQQPTPILGLPGILARAIGRNIEDIYKGNNKGLLAEVDLLQRITETCRAMVGLRGGCQGRVRGIMG